MKLCECGCGEETNLAPYTYKKYGWKKGEHMKYIHGHNTKGENNPYYRPSKERFWEKVNKTDTCWLWIAATGRFGYGQFWSKNKMVSVHRFSYELCKGKIPKGMVLDHLCRVRHCVNPEHLEVVTGLENSRRGRQSKLNEEKVKEIRELYKNGKYSRKQISQKYNMSKHAIFSIVTNKTWKEV
jgi:hypothetical protein